MKKWHFEMTYERNVWNDMTLWQMTDEWWWWNEWIWVWHEWNDIMIKMNEINENMMEEKNELDMFVWHFIRNENYDIIKWKKKMDYE